MKNKNVYITLLVIFLGLCVYNIVCTGIRLAKDGELNELSSDERAAKLADKDYNDNYKFVVNRSLSLGLDLQGGMYVTMQIAVEDILQNLAKKNADSAFVAAIRAASKARESASRPYVDLFYEQLQKIKPGKRLADYFGGERTGLSYNATDDEVKAKLREIVETSIKNSYTVIRTRIDQFGVASPDVQREEGTGRILIQLPGVKDADRVRKLLRGTANLEFWPTYTLEQFFPYLQKINERVKLQETASQAVDDDKKPTADAKTDAPGDSAAVAAAEKAKTDTLDSAAVAKMSDDEKRELFKKENPFFALCDFRIAGNPQNNQPMVGYTLVSDTAKVNRILNNPEVRRILPSDVLFFWSAKPVSEEAQYFTLYAIRGNRDGQAALNGSAIVDAREDKDQFKQNVVSMTMNTEGARIWKKMTQDNLGKSVAVVLDNLVYTAPTVQSVITNGSSQITGSFSIEEAKDLANILKAGKLDAPARIEGEEVVGPTLGAETVRRGFISFLAGFIGVILFMLAYYKKAGVVASIALIFNLIFIVGIASALNVVLNLPGIAGVVLTMGMAVDANVLIYERIREELESGKSQKGSIAGGFGGAFSAILDGNLTTFLTGAILYLFGSGLIRGFAVMLMIGIATTLITGLLVTRLILDYLTAKREAQIDFGSRAAVAFFKRVNLQFIEKRKTSFVVAGAIAAIFLLLMTSGGFKYGVDFLGGRQYVVEFASAPDVDRLRAELSKNFQSDPQIKTIGGSNQVMVTTTFKLGEQDADDAVKGALLAGCETAAPGSKPTVLRTTNVGPTVAEDIKEGARYAIFFSLLGMFLYILLRFRGWQFGLGATISLAFNVIVVLGLFSLFSLLPAFPFSIEVDAALIASILTIVGYTINDTVVVFDRIREHTENAGGKTPLTELFNKAINSTLSRTLITSTTTLITALILFLFGGEVLRGFMFALMVGVVVGTFSSIFIASPLTLQFILMKPTRAQLPAAASVQKP